MSAALTDAIGRALGGGSSGWSLFCAGEPPMSDANEAAIVATKPATKRLRKMAREPKADAAEHPAPTTDPVRPQSKTDLVLILLQRSDGATIEQLVAATGWADLSRSAIR
jgi:hypothetical protein